MNIVTKLNEIGLKIPLLYDNRTNKGSITFTTLAVSILVVLIHFGINIGAYIYGITKGTDPKYIPLNDALWWHISCAALYLGKNTLIKDLVKKGTNEQETT
jgi:hypothetical protein